MAAEDSRNIKRSISINGSVSDSAFLSGNFYGPVTFGNRQPSERANEYKRPPKPSTFRGESNIFVGRQEDITKIRQYLNESNSPIAIIGEGGIGKSALAFITIHECEDMFDVIIPIYFESVLTFHSFLLEMARSLQLPMTIDQFERLDNLEERAQIIKDALSEYRGRALIYADNYETIRNLITSANNNKSSTIQQSIKQEDAIKVNNFLKGVPKNTSILLTSRQRHNLTGERILHLDGLSIEDGRDLFIKVAGNKLPKKLSTKIKKAIGEISKKTGGHPLSIEILASTSAKDLLPELNQMLKHLGAGVVDPEKEKSSRHKSLEACFEYSISKLPETHKLLLPKLAVMFKSPFPASAVEYIFSSGKPARTGTATDIIGDLHDSCLLRRIDFDEYGDIEGKYRLYHFHLSVRNYLEHKVQQEEGNKKQQELEEKYGDRFSVYYNKLLEETYNAKGMKNHVLSVERFNVLISHNKVNDFERAVKLAKDSSLASAISTGLGIILSTLGRFSAALEYFKKSLAIDEDLMDTVRMAGDHNNIGLVLSRQGNHDQALQYHKKALAINEKLKDRVGMARDYGNIGAVLQAQGNHNQALECLERALKIHEGRKDRVGMARDYRYIGILLDERGNHNQALEYHKKALAIDDKLKDRVGMAKDYVNIGVAFRNQADYDEALSYHRKALKIHEGLRDKAEMAKDYGYIGAVFSSRSSFAIELGAPFSSSRDRERAIESFSKGLEIFQKLEEKKGFRHPFSDKIQEAISQLEGIVYNRKKLKLRT